MSKLINTDAYEELQSSYISLEQDKNFLEKRVQEEIAKRQVHENILERQSRFAVMGEMMDAVAHQWTQPLCIIDMNVNLMTDDFKNKLIDKNYINKAVKSINIQTKHLQSTLNKFRHFFNPTDTTELFDLNEMVKETLLLLEDEILKHHLLINYIEKEECIVHGSQSEVKHVLINLINNAKDAFNSNNIKNRPINISIVNKSSYCDLVVQDSAGGIDENIINEIFEPYISTKNSGIGLYMSRLIMQKHHGEISAKNIKNGTEFIVKFHKDNK